MIEESLGAGSGFKPEVTQAEFFDQSQRIFQEALAGTSFAPEKRKRLEIIFGGVQTAYLQNPEVNLSGRDVLRQGLRLAQLRERGVPKERIFKERKSLESSCGKLVDSLGPHVSQLPSRREIAEAASRMAVEIQKMKAVGLKQPDLARAMTELLKGSDEGQMRPGCLVGAGLLAALVLAGAIFVEGTVFRGKHLRGGETSPQNIVLTLKQDDFNRLTGTFYSLQNGWENPDQPSPMAIYYEEVWGINIHKDLGDWLAKNPKASEDDKKKLIDKLLKGKEPTFNGGFLEWYDQKWLPRLTP